MVNEILIAGFGGQGVMLMGQILAHAGMEQDLHVSWMPSYGPEQRGGTANCGVVISEDPVGSPVVTEPTECVVMNLPSLEKFESSVRPSGHLFVNSSLCDQEVKRDDIQVVTIPVTEEADRLGNARVANMIMLGALASCLPNLPFDAIKASLRAVLPERHHQLIPINEKALERGRELYQQQ